MKILNMIPIGPIDRWLDWGKPIVIAIAISVSIFLVLTLMYWIIKKVKKKNE